MPFSEDSLLRDTYNSFIFFAIVTSSSSTRLANMNLPKKHLSRILKRVSFSDCDKTNTRHMLCDTCVHSHAYVLHEMQTRLHILHACTDTHHRCEKLDRYDTYATRSFVTPFFLEGLARL